MELVCVAQLSNLMKRFYPFFHAVKMFVSLRCLFLIYLNEISGYYSDYRLN